MSLTPGTRFGSYEIVGPIGAGGMGEVYRARDTRLNREVAIKVLPDIVAQDPERLGRFEREAKVLASFTHPNIATLYALEQLNDRPVLVMELAEGDDLTRAIERGPMAVTDALPIAVQIALGLEAAHEKGIVHRDLKPANIKVSEAGAVKVLDFGLAKALGPEGASATADAMNSPTLTAQATAAGIILGTAAYMSPEQARGRSADKRADIWSFGVVLFEMLTGQRLFAGETMSDTLAAVLRQDIDWKALPAASPSELTRLLRRCLERDPKNRLHDIGDARIVLEEIARGGGAADTPPVAAPSGSRQPAWLTWAIAAITLAIGLVAGRWISSGHDPSAIAPALVRLSMPVPAGVTRVVHVATAPDGTFVVFMGLSGGNQQLYVRRLDDLAPRLLDRTEGAESPVVSADSKWIGFSRANHLEKIAVSGGEPIRIVDTATDAPGYAWGPDNTIFVTTSWYSGLSAVSANGGALRIVTTVDTAHGEKAHWFPQFLPDGRHALFTIFRSAGGLNDAQLAVLDVASGKYQVVMQGAYGSYVAPGFLVFYRAGAYQAVRFDLPSLAPSGDPVTVLTDDRGISPDGSRPTLSIAANGTLAYVPGQLAPSNVLTWIAEGAKAEPLTFLPRSFLTARLAPNGRQIAAGLQERGEYVIRLLDLDRGTDDALELPGSNWTPIWSPDGKRIAMRTMRKGDYDTFVKDVGSSSPPVQLLATPFDESPYAWPTEKKLVISQSAADGRYRLKLLDLDAPDRPSALSENAATAVSSSPDGRWLAIADSHTGRSEIYVRPVTGDRVPERITANGGVDPVWLRNGKDLLYVRGLDIIAVSWRDDGGRIKVERERVWAHLTGEPVNGLFDAGADGRVLVGVPKDAPPPPQVRIILNWQEELARKLAR